MLPAPGRLSMTNVCPRESPSFWPSVRASTSELPPGAYGTMKRMNLVGYCVCASAGHACNVSASRSAAIELIRMDLRLVQVAHRIDGIGIFRALVRAIAFHAREPER